MTAGAAAAAEAATPSLAPSSLKQEGQRRPACTQSSTIQAGSSTAGSPVCCLACPFALCTTYPPLLFNYASATITDNSCGRAGVFFYAPKFERDGRQC